MSLTAADVAEIMRLVEQSTFDELTLEMDGTRLTLRRGAAALSTPRSDASTGTSGLSAARGSDASTGTSGPSAARGSDASTGTSGLSAARASVGQTSAPGEAATRAGASAPPDADHHDVPSPLLGTFYRSPKPGAPPFVEPGSPVEENTIVAIIEVMKLMNTVRAGVRGAVTEIFPPDGSLVEYDQPLLRIRKTS
ncbi:MAG: biotin/lipoyl-containing protein [Gammaproteobacteria bacterium]